jgi:hypothetical protein
MQEGQGLLVHLCISASVLHKLHQKILTFSLLVGNFGI